MRYNYTAKKILILFTLILGISTIWLSSCGKKSNDAHPDHAAETKKATKYHCPMHPTYVSDKPGDCPICNMRLVPVPEEEGEAMAKNVPQEHSEDHSSGMPVSERAPVSLSPDRQQLIGVRSAPVAQQDLKILVRASGRVAYDPDLYNAIIEYREAIKTKEKVKENPWPDIKERTDTLIRSSVLRLRQMGLSQTQIDELSKRTEDPTNLLLSEKGGLVWIYAQIYEYEAGLVKPGQTMEVTSMSHHGRSLTGRVFAVDANLNPETRTLRVRGEIPNPEGLLRPEMYVDVTIHINLGNKLAVPKEAVLDTGTRRIVFVEGKPGQYEPREIKIGREAEAHYEIVSGVKEGERVVISANFLIDSESKLKAAISGAGHAH